MNNLSVKKIPDPSKEIPVVREVDVLVVGGGPAGIGAALSAARLGARTLVIEQYNCLGGVGTAGGHHELTMYNSWNSDERVLGGIPFELRERIIAEGKGNIDLGSDLFYDGEAMKLLLDKMMKEAGVEILFYSLFSQAIMDGNSVIGAVIQNKSGRQAILAQHAIDCTGDGDVAASAGCAFWQGRDSDGLSQPVTLMFNMGNVDWPTVKKWWTDWDMKPVWKKAQDDGIMEPFQEKIMGLIHTPSQPDIVGINMTHITHIDTTNGFDLSNATIEGRRQSHHLASVFNKVVPGMENARLISTAPAIGTRESRRIKGDIVLTEKDLQDHREWEDVICYGSFFIDIHNPSGPGMSEEHYYPAIGFRYQIPYRTMLPVDVDNLLVAGRCISTTHVALGSTRVMLTCMALGEAAGAAAALAGRAAMTVRLLPVGILQTQLKIQGVIIDEEGIAAANCKE